MPAPGNQQIRRRLRTLLSALAVVLLFATVLTTVASLATSRPASAQVACDLVHEPADFTIDSITDLQNTGSGSGAFTLPDGSTTGTWDISHTFPTASNSTETGYVSNADVGGDGRLALLYSGPAGDGVFWNLEAQLNVTVSDPSVDYYLVWFGSSDRYNPASLFSTYNVSWTPATEDGVIHDPADQTNQTDGAVFSSGDSFTQLAGPAVSNSWVNNDLEWHVATPVNTDTFTVEAIGGKTGEAFGFAITQLVWSDGCAPPVATNSSVDRAIGTSETFDISTLATDVNDDMDLSTVRLVDPADSSLVTSLTVAGEGTWTVNTTTGEITFVPESGFDGVATTVEYQVGDVSEQNSNLGQLSVNYLPEAVDDSTTNNTIGDDVVIDPLANDVGDLDETTVQLVDPADSSLVTSLTVTGEGTWTVNTTTGVVTFAPEAGFEGDPTPVDYQVADGNGDTTQATISHNYVPAAVDDSSSGNTVGDAVTIDPLANDSGNLDETTVALIDPDTGNEVTSLTVTGEGTWTVNATTGAITFTPEAGFENSPTPVDYTVETTDGDVGRATVTVTYLGDPAIAMTKNAPTGTLAPGQNLTYTFDVENTGDVSLTGVAISDPLIASVTCTDTTIAPGETTTCSGTMTVTQAQFDAGSITNTATASGDGAGQTVEATDSVTTSTTSSWTADLSAAKAVTDNADEDGSGDVSVGDTLTYTITVTNDGNVTLSNGSVADPTAGDPTCPATSLAPDASMDCTVDYTVTQSDVDAGEIVNTATASADDPGGTTHTGTDTNTQSITRTSGVSIDKSTTTTVVQVDDVIDYTITVTNTGNVTLSDVDVDDPLTSNESCPATSLAPGDSMDCTASYTVTQSDIDRRGVDNTATVTATEPDGAAGAVTDSDTASVSAGAAMPSIMVAKDATNADEDGSADVSLDDTLTYTITVTNNGDVTVNNISVTDPTAGDPTCPGTSLAPSASMDCTVDYTVTQADVDAGEIVNTAAAAGQATDGTDLSESATNTQTIDRTGSMTVDKTASATQVAVDDQIDYTITVTNTGNVTLANIAIDDPLTTDESCPATTLAPGASMDCTASYVVTQADIDAGGVVNTVTAAGTQPDGTPLGVTAEGSVTVGSVAHTPGHTVAKSVSGNADEDGSGDVSVDDTLTYTITVTNTGNVTLTNVSVTDPIAGDPTCPATSLAPDASMDCPVDYTVTQADVDAGEIVNTATAEVDDPGGNTHTETGTNTQGITRTASISAAKSAAPGDLAVDTVVEYTITVSNTGNVTLSDIDLDDPLTADESCPASTLAPGSSMDCTASYTVTQADVNAGMFDNTATVTATQPGGTPGAITDSSTASFPVEQTPNITMTKTLDANADEDGSGDISLNDTLTYTFVVTNTGNVTVFDVAVDDPKAGTPTCPATLIVPGSTLECRVDYVVAQADMDAAEIVNQATVDATGPLDQPVTDSATATTTIAQNPDVAFAKSAPTGDLVVGETVSYTITATNTGNVTLSNLEVADPLAESVTCDTDTIAPGEVATCTADMIVTQDHVDAGAINNTATLIIEPPVGPSITTTATNKTDIDQNPDVDVVKSAPVGDLVVGETVIYTITITNTGDVTVDIADVSDPMAESVTCDLASIAPGDIATCTADVVVTQDHVDSGGINNTATAIIEPPVGPAITTTGTNKTGIDQHGDFVTDKSAPIGEIAVGKVVTYTITVTNTGNVTLFDIEVDDPIADTVECQGLGVLSPGEIATCLATVKITQDHVDSGQITNTATTVVTLPTGVKVPGTGTNTTEIDQNPDVEVVKSAPVGELVVGKTVVYTITATNTGDVTLSNLTVTDPLADSVSCGIDSIAPGEAASCTADVVVTQDHVDAGGIANTATVVIQPPIGPAITKTGTNETDIDQKGSIEVDKGDPVGELKVGETVSYPITVTNTGNVTVFAIKVTDPIATSVDCDIVDQLPPDETATCTAEVVVTQAQVDAGGISNTATTEVTLPTGEKITSTGTNETGIDWNASVDVVKSKPVGELVVGEKVLYTITVTNTGDVTLARVRVTDPMADTVTCDIRRNLAPGRVSTCTAEVVVTQDHVDAGGIDNTAKATVTLPDGTRIHQEGNNKTDIDRNSDVAISKTFVSGELVLGAQVVFEIVIANTGNTTVTSFEAVDPLAESITCDVDRIAPGAAATCKAIYRVTQIDIDRGAIINPARVVAKTPTGDIEKNVTSRTVVEQFPGMGVTKTAKIDGDDITYTITVRNTGTTTLVNAVVVDPMLSSAPLCTIHAIAPRESASCTGVHRITPAEYQANSITNSAKVGAQTPDGEVLTAEITITTALEDGTAADDTGEGNRGQPVYVDVLHNDTDADPASLQLVDPETGVAASEVVVAGEGVWQVSNGVVVFRPASSSVSEPTPISYVATTAAGQKLGASVAVVLHRYPWTWDDEPTPTPTPSPTATPEPQDLDPPLAYTGANSGQLAGLAMALAATGGLFLVAAHRRSEDENPART